MNRRPVGNGAAAVETDRAGQSPSLPAAADTAAEPRHETVPLPHGLTAVIELREAV